MQKNIIIAILAVISVASLGYIAFAQVNSGGLSPEQAKNRAEQFINEVLLQPGVSAELGEVTKENGLYTIPITLPDGTNFNTYLSANGQIFFPEGLNVDEVTQQVADNEENNNQATSMPLQTETLTEGTGDQVVENGDSITVEYTGTLEDGTVFDSSASHDEPFTFTIGQGEVIAGWDQGILGMKVGEERKLTIPPDLAYGSYGTGSIPPNSTLIFTVKLLSINSEN